MSSGIRRAKELYLAENTQSSPPQSSSKKEKGSSKKHNDNSLRSSKMKVTPYGSVGTNYYFPHGTHSSSK